MCLLFWQLLFNLIELLCRLVRLEDYNLIGTSLALQKDLMKWVLWPVWLWIFFKSLVGQEERILFHSFCFFHFSAYNFRHVCAVLNRKPTITIGNQPSHMDLSCSTLPDSSQLLFRNRSCSDFNHTDLSYSGIRKGCMPGKDKGLSDSIKIVNSTFTQ